MHKVLLEFLGGKGRIGCGGSPFQRRTVSFAQQGSGIGGRGRFGRVGGDGGGGCGVEAGAVHRESGVHGASAVWVRPFADAMWEGDDTPECVVERLTAGARGEGTQQKTRRTHAPGCQQQRRREYQILKNRRQRETERERAREDERATGAGDAPRPGGWACGAEGEKSRSEANRGEARQKGGGGSGEACCWWCWWCWWWS